jgi:hypothetical protein
VDGRGVAGQEDGADDPEPDLQVQAGAHDDVVDGRLGECRPHLVEPRRGAHLDVLHAQRLLGVLDDATEPPEQQDPRRHARSRPARRLRRMP